MSFELSPEREEYRRLLTKDEREALKENALKILDVRGTPSYPREIATRPELHSGKESIRSLGGSWSSSYDRNPTTFGATARSQSVSLERNLTDIFDQPSDSEIIDTISTQLDREPYAEFSPRHFLGSTEDKMVVLDSSNPYLDQLEQYCFDARDTYFLREWPKTGNQADIFAWRFEDRPIPVIGPIAFDLLRAYRLDGETFVSAYNKNKNILTNWRPLDTTTLTYGLPKQALTAKEMAERYGRSANQPQILFDDEQIALAVRSLEQILEERNSWVAQPDYKAYSLLAEHEARRYGPKTLLFRAIGSAVLERVASKEGFFVEHPTLNRQTTFFTSRHNIAVRAQKVVTRSGTIWIQDTESGLEVPFRQDTFPENRVLVDLHTRDLTNILYPKKKNNRFLRALVRKEYFSY